MIKSLPVLFLLLFSLQGLAQHSPYSDETYKVEDVFGIVKATNGGLISGLYFRHSWSLNNDNLAHYSIELANVKHPRETKETTFTGSSFVFGKSNYLVPIRLHYGRERILFKKAPQQGVRVSGLLSGGPSFGLEVPYYVNLGNRREQYDPTNPDHSRSLIIGSSGPFRGLFESKIVLGFHVKASLTFETNSTKNRVFGVEAGFTFETFTRKIEIIPVADNKSSYAAAFLAIYFGRRR